MDVEIKREAAFAGQRVKQKVVFALALCSVIPLLVLTYVIHGHLVPGFESTAQGMTDVLAIPIPGPDAGDLLGRIRKRIPHSFLVETS